MPVKAGFILSEVKMNWLMLSYRGKLLAQIWILLWNLQPDSKDLLRLMVMMIINYIVRVRQIFYWKARIYDIEDKELWSSHNELKVENYFIRECYILNYVTSKFKWWSPKPKYLRMWLNLGIGLLKRQVEMRSLGWALIQTNWYPCKRRLEHTKTKTGMLTHREKAMWGYREKVASYKPKRQALSGNQSCLHLNLGFQTSRTWENKYLLFNLVYRIFVAAVLAN